MNELPPWDSIPPYIALRDTASMPAQAIRELWGNPQFQQEITSTLAPEGKMPFVIHVGGRQLFDDVSHGRGSWDAEGGSTGAATIFNSTGTMPVMQAGMAFDVDRIMNAANGDSALARELMRDAVVHEFGHVLPVARSRSLDSRVADPAPGRNDGPAMEQENYLRSLLGLPPRTSYALKKR